LATRLDRLGVPIIPYGELGLAFAPWAIGRGDGRHEGAEAGQEGVDRHPRLRARVFPSSPQPRRRLGSEPDEL
jgi:hypothetical protein